jgi:hypothetical protein
MSPAMAARITDRLWDIGDIVKLIEERKARDMRLLLTITVTALALAGCAGNYDKAADANVCEPSTPASQGVTSQLFPSSRLTVPARSLLGSGKLDNDDTMTYACIDPKGNRTNAPQVPNLHKIRLDHLSDAI